MILGVDLGQRTTGLAISEGELASPFKTITHKNPQEALIKIIALCDELDAHQVIVGYVEGKIKPMFENFAKKLQSAKSDLKVILWDETLTSRQATENMVKLQVAKTKRAKKQHEVAAALILQSYLDSN